MIKVLFKISKNLEEEYLNSLKEVLSSLKKKDKLSNLSFEYESYNFGTISSLQLQTSSNAFLNARFAELGGELFNSVVYIPKSSLNLKDNYLWYSIGTPKKHAMIISSYLFKELIEKEIDFGAYILILYLQFLARYTVKIEKPHSLSRNCLNDHCANQIELLNVLKNEKDVFCDECLIKIENKEYHLIIKDIINFIKKNYCPKKITKEEIIKFDSTIVKPKEPKVKMIPEKGSWYEFEIYMAKKCSNLSKLYGELDKLILKSRTTSQ